MGKSNTTSNCKEPDPVFLEYDVLEYDIDLDYDIDDVKLSIQDTIEAIEKIYVKSEKKQKE